MSSIMGERFKLTRFFVGATVGTVVLTPAAISASRAARAAGLPAPTESGIISPVKISWKIGSQCLFDPLLEEIVFRPLIKRKLIKGDALTQKVVRVISTSLLFTAYHLKDASTMDGASLKHHLIRTFVIGIGSGILYETKLKMSGALGAHITCNVIITAGELINRNL